MFTAVFEPPRRRLPAVPAVRAHRPTPTCCRRTCSRSTTTALRAAVDVLRRTLAPGAAPRAGRGRTADPQRHRLPGHRPAAGLVAEPGHGAGRRHPPDASGRRARRQHRPARRAPADPAAAPRRTAASGTCLARSGPTRRTCASTGRRRSAGRWPTPGRRLSGGPVAAWGARSWFRLCAAVPALRRRAFAGEWTAPAAPRDVGARRRLNRPRALAWVHAEFVRRGRGRGRDRAGARVQPGPGDLRGHRAHPRGHEADGRAVLRRGSRTA